MIYSPQDLLGTTESLLKYDEDERLSEASPQHLHNALGRAVMIAVGDNWAKSRARRAGKRKAYYLSAEYLVGRLVYNNLFNLGILDEMRRVFAERGIDLACLEEIEDAGSRQRRSGPSCRVLYGQRRHLRRAAERLRSALPLRSFQAEL